MLSVNKILFPVDFSERCQSAAPYVAELANQLRARLDLLHVVEAGSHIAELRRQSAAALAAFARHIPHGMYCPQTVALGDPAEAIVRYAKTHGIDVIAMPRGNGSSLSQPASVTRKILRDAACAVWTGLFTGHREAGRGPVLCAVDVESADEQVLSYASALARNLRSALMVVSPVPARAVAAQGAAARGGPWHDHSDLSFELSRIEAQYKLDELLEGMNISAEATIEAGTPEEAIGRAAERTGAALLVLGRGSRAGEPEGMDTYELGRRVPCPVVFCPPRPAAPVCFWTEWQQEEHSQQADSSLDLVSGLSR
jgi:nucleotide-binding universal stress UspA family protein